MSEAKEAPRSELNQMLVKQLEAMSPEEFKEAKDFIWERYGSQLVDEKEGES